MFRTDYLDQRIEVRLLQHTGENVILQYRLKARISSGVRRNNRAGLSKSISSSVISIQLTSEKFDI